jgi:NAD(P)-dependent dehydrogenase (short-subunit alcohol dehydrogenase family)
MADGIRTFHGSVSVITGGASGIGRALAMELAKRGAGEIVIADLQSALAEETAEAIRRASSRATVMTLDVRDDAAVERMFADVARSAGRIDYVFNNAGTGVMGEAHLLEKHDWDQTIDINVGGLVNVVRAAYPRLIAQGYGHLVTRRRWPGSSRRRFCRSTRRRSISWWGCRSRCASRRRATAFA